MTYKADEDASAEEREIAAAMKRLRAHRIVFHGLRKNAVIMLLEVGCTEDEVGAIVGMSPAMHGEALRQGGTQTSPRDPQRSQRRPPQKGRPRD
jgi:hypothetical protein